MQIQLQMVGAYQNTNKSFKGIPFVNGRATVTCADEHVAGICRYLQQFGAYQLVEAEQRQAFLDKEAGVKISKKVAMDRVARHRAALATAEAELAELDQLDGEKSEPQLAEASEPAPAKKPSRKPAARVVVPEEAPAEVEAAPTETESEADDGGSSDQQAPRRERSETPKGGKGSAKAGQGGE